MPGIPFPGRPGGEHDEPLLDMLFGARVLPPDAPPEVHDLARMLAALAGPADPSELAGEAAAVAAFSHFASPVGISPRSVSPGLARHRQSRRPAHRRLSLRRAMDRPASRRPVRLTTAAKALVGAAAMVGGIAAAYSGALPGPIQQVAHITINAPAPPPAARHPAVKPGQRGRTSPTPVPGSQPAPPPRQPAASGVTGRTRQPSLASTATGVAADPLCEPGPWQPQDLRPGYPGALPPGLAKAGCPAPVTPTPVRKPTALPSSPGKSTAKATPAPSKSAQTPAG